MEASGRACDERKETKVETNWNGSKKEKLATGSILEGVPIEGGRGEEGRDENDWDMEGR